MGYRSFILRMFLLELYSGTCLVDAEDATDSLMFICLSNLLSSGFFSSSYHTSPTNFTLILNSLLSTDLISSDTSALNTLFGEAVV